MRAIDLYSGVGGWSLGLSLAGIEVVASYERFEPANETNRKNNRHTTVSADIRSLDLELLPKNIDLVVGSPPCTQFSYSNRGGGGDLADGLQDIRCFLSIVAALKPRFWAMENVPRTAEIVTRELQLGGKLADFAHLVPEMAVVNMEDWGLPQRRRRCIIGSFDFDLLFAYRAGLKRRTLGDVVSALEGEVVTDPIYGLKLHRTKVIDHVKEPSLNEEEARVNRAAKAFHPVYNAMAFPDPLEKSARTITATCTRVSRESIVIAERGPGGDFRRLTLRERSLIQGFPATFQFFGSSHGQKATMIGNAVPPAFSYFIANACLRVQPEELEPLDKAIVRFVPPTETPLATKVDLAGGRYRADRTFRFAVPEFNFKSGVRFELSNRKHADFPAWGVSFYFGSSTDIRSLKLDDRTLDAAKAALPIRAREEILALTSELVHYVKAADIKRMQDVWTRRGPGGTRPFDLIDRLSDFASLMRSVLAGLDAEQLVLVLAQIIRAEHRENAVNLPGLAKLERLAPSIVAGAIMGAAVNEALSPTELVSSPVRASSVA